MHLVGFTIEMCYDARPCERQICLSHVTARVVTFSSYFLKVTKIIAVLLERISNWPTGCKVAGCLSVALWNWFSLEGVARTG